MSRIICILAILVTFISPADLRADDSAYLQLVEQADKHIAKGEWTQAEQLYREAIRLEPTNPGNILLTTNIGMLQYYDDRATEAIATLTRAHEEAPASVTVLMNRAKVYTALQLIPQAMADYRTVCCLDTLMAEPHYYLALLELQQADTAQAQLQTDTIAMLQPDSYYRHMAQATIYLSSGKISPAMPHLTKVIELDPDASHYARRALCYLMLDDLAAASDDIASGLALDPTSGELYLYRAMLNKLRYRPDDARSDAEKAILYGIPSQRVSSLLQ
ncbi:MAG: hypothetical protein J6C77_06665 [Muribaculaceae bacterium]|nr:hypothetical protein [Muribaculaceae bacterium]